MEICAHCMKRVVFDGTRYVHFETRLARCLASSLAEPIGARA